MAEPKSIDIELAKQRLQRIIDIVHNQGGYKEFEPQLRKMVKSKTGMRRFYSMPLMEIIFDLELHYRGIQHTHQYSIYGYRVDFCLNKVGAVIEIDGAYHNTKEQQRADEIRDSIMENLFHIPVTRVSDASIAEDLQQATDIAIRNIAIKSKHLGRKHISNKLVGGPSLALNDMLGLSKYMEDVGND